VSLAVLAVGASDLSGLRVTFAYGIEGGFARGVAALLVGVGLVWGGLLLRRAPAGPTEAPEAPEVGQVEEVEEVVYVFVDERGVEHEISAEEAERLQERLAAEPVVEEQDVGPTRTAPDPGPPTTPTPASPSPSAGGDVVYVFVDEDGVEHEVAADELDGYEVVDEEETR
jgi:hypothetical protein